MAERSVRLTRWAGTNSDRASVRLGPLANRSRWNEVAAPTNSFECAPRVDGVLLDYDRAEMATRIAVHEHLAAAERYMKANAHLKRRAVSQNVHIAEASGWPDWHLEASRLETTAKAFPAYQDTYRADVRPLDARIGQG